MSYMKQKKKTQPNSRECAIWTGVWKSSLRELNLILFSEYKENQSQVVFYWDQPFLVGWVGQNSSCCIWDKLFSVGLVEQRFDLHDWSRLWRTIVARIRSYRVSTEDGWRSVPLSNVNRTNPTWLRLKQQILEHDLRDKLQQITCH